MLGSKGPSIEKWPIYEESNVHVTDDVTGGTGSLYLQPFSRYWALIKRIGVTSLTFQGHVTSSAGGIVVSDSGTRRNAVLTNVFEPERRSGKYCLSQAHSRDADTATF